MTSLTILFDKVGSNLVPDTPPLGYIPGTSLYWRCVWYKVRTYFIKKYAQPDQPEHPPSKDV